jgi:DNA/RNA endonuclease G (NUC1)
MKKFTLIFLSLLLVNSLYSQEVRNIVTNTFIVKYSEELEQPLYVFYNVLCPNGESSRSGLDFKKYDGVHTSNNEDYVDNVWDKGHLAPAAAFNLNCALQHQSLNRGPWRELEEFERNLAKIYDKVNVTVECHFSKSSTKLPTGAIVPDGFTKIIKWDGREECFYFPNDDVKGINWIEFRITND